MDSSDDNIAAPPNGGGISEIYGEELLQVDSDLNHH